MKWTDELKCNITTRLELQDFFSIENGEIENLDKILEMYPMSISRYYLSLIDRDDENDPIRKMCVPSFTETDLDGKSDTSGEAGNTIMMGLQHKYSQTALILSTNSCAMYCRHCFRKRMVGTENSEEAKNIVDIMKYIDRHKEISNVLISGGDSFLNSNGVIEKYLEALSEMEHIDFIRFGTRLPVVLPSRIYDDKNLLAILQKYNRKKAIYIVTQFNHPKEITAEAIKAVDCLEKIGITVKNQAVLLKGVNDDPRVLADLFRKLTACGVDPYYLFQCRPVVGVKNQFQVPLMKGYGIVEKAKGMLNGFGKGFNFVMSHETGKMEILGTFNDKKMLFKYHESKDCDSYGKIFEYEVSDDQCWLELYSS